jgi:hypothetical protein
VTCIYVIGSLTGNCGLFVFVASLSSGAVMLVALGVPRAIVFSCVLTGAVIWGFLKDGLFWHPILPSEFLSCPSNGSSLDLYQEIFKV